MSRSNNFSYTASANITSSFSQSSSDHPQGKTKTFHQSMTSNDRDGTTIRRMQQESGKPTVHDESYIPPGGRRVESAPNSGNGRRIEDVTDQDQQSQADRDRQYEERMEDEYAKREGGA